MKHKDIIWKDKIRRIPIPHCPECKKELYETGKDYRPYSCECGEWFWDEENECYHVKE